ncbi:hypothetical protein U1839_22410 [Sphingomonas sp. RT2P30]|uniref:hypothetical protein n=1 Tax=Parasphingomonas halimpatiens TaxID=3096162 RepID=UPI002FC5A9EF
MPATMTTEICTGDVAKRPMFIAAKLFTTAGKMMVTVLDISSEAIVATTDTPPPLDSIVVVARAGVRVPAVLDWIDGHRLGLRLDEPLETCRVDQFVGAARPAISFAAPLRDAA